MGIGAVVRRLARWRWIEAFLLREAARVAASYPPARQGQLRSLVQAGELRSRAADELIDDFAVAALALYREAAVLYMAALLSAAGLVAANETLLPERVVHHFASLETRATPPCSDADFRAFLLLVADPDPLLIDRTTRFERAARIGRTREMVHWLRTLLEPRSLMHVRALRVVRIALASFLVVGSLFWGIRELRKPKNIALHAPVTTSSVHPHATSSAYGLTDGVTAGSYGVHTNTEEKPWVQIDLGDVYRIDTVKIYNRGDGWFDAGMPMTLLFSEDGTEFASVDTRAESFDQWAPWVFEAGKKRARYVRVNGARGTIVALNEIEVFGKK
jgi:hypothetical protein